MLRLGGTGAGGEMKTIRGLLNVRMVLAAVAIVVAVGVYVGSLPDSEALIIAGPSVCIYYKDARFTKVVGARGTGCCGETISWGKVTRYVRCERLYCLDVECPF